MHRWLCTRSASSDIKLKLKYRSFNYQQQKQMLFENNNIKSKHKILGREQITYTVCQKGTGNLKYTVKIQWVYCTTWPAVARAGEASTYSRRIAYIPANSSNIIHVWTGLEHKSVCRTSEDRCGMWASQGVVNRVGHMQVWKLSCFLYSEFTVRLGRR